MNKLYNGIYTIIKLQFQGDLCFSHITSSQLSWKCSFLLPWHCTFKISWKSIPKCVF